MQPCNQCGKCCKLYGDGGLHATSSEISWWETFRPDIARYVKDGNIWVDPDSGQQLSRCPWLQKQPDINQYTCQIYHDRPNDCKHYPVTIEEMVTDECEMLDVIDLTNPVRAQVALDKIMIDSRPPRQTPPGGAPS